MFRKKISVILCLAMFLTIFPLTSLAQTTPPVKPGITQPGSVRITDPIQPNGELVVYLLKNNTWQKLQGLSFSRFLQEKQVDLGNLSSEVETKIRLVQKGGGAAHLDSVLLNGLAPVKVNGGEGLIDKLSKNDNDLINLDKTGIELTFNAGKSLSITARIENTVISKTPFQFPTENLYRAIDSNAEFYSYKINSETGSAEIGNLLKMMSSKKPFFREYVVPESGHPAGYTYGWVTNDDKNLYVALDFTPDNTMDGEKDYAKVYVKTKDGIKEFIVSVPENNWGRPFFTYTDKVAYQHKVYEFAIPLKELSVTGAESGELDIAFSAYGTAAAGFSENNNYTVYENQGAVTISVISYYPGVFQVVYRTEDGTATAGADYESAEGILEFGQNYQYEPMYTSTPEIKTFTITIKDDKIPEPDETVNIYLDWPIYPYNISEINSDEDNYMAKAELKIIDDDSQSFLQFSSDEYPVSESVYSGLETITVTRTGNLDSVVEVAYHTGAENDTAAVGEDYGETTGTLIFNAGEASKFFTVPIIDDEFYEGEETAALYLSNPTNGAILGQQSQAQLIIDDNGQLQFDPGSYTVNENGGSVPITVTLTDRDYQWPDCGLYSYSTVPGSEYGSVVTVAYSTSGGSALPGSDYKTTAGELTFPEGVTNQSFAVPIIEDSSPESTETFNIILSNPAGGAQLGEPATGQVNIIDNDRRSSGGGGGGTVETAPDGGLIDRGAGAMPLGDAIKIEQSKNEIVLDYVYTKLKSNLTPRAYYWNTKAKKWVALATYQVDNGKVKAINDGGYKGWFKVFGVVEPIFTDTGGHWAEQVTNRMNGLGMIEGYPGNNGNTLRPAKLDQNITRVEFTVILTRLLNINPDEPGLTLPDKEKAISILKAKFSDADKVPDWALSAVAAAAEANLTAGRDGKFDPESPITRIEATVMVSNALKKLPGYKAEDLTSFKDSTDIPVWAAASVADNLINGYPDGTLKPNEEISRGEALTVFHKLFINGMGW